MLGFGKSSSPSEWVIKNIENGLYVTVGTFGTSEGGLGGGWEVQPVSNAQGTPTTQLAGFLVIYQSTLLRNFNGHNVQVTIRRRNWRFATLGRQ